MKKYLSSIPLRFYLTAFCLFSAFSFVTRVALLLASFSEMSFDLPLLGAFGIGMIFDIAAGIFAALPWLLVGILLPDKLLKMNWMRWLLAVFAVIYTGILVFITTAEWFFWDEFGARFNFIAVDYLIWTQKVWGNISESYPMGLIIPAIAITAVLIVFALKKMGAFNFAAAPRTTFRHRLVALAALLTLPFLTFKLVRQSAIHEFTNQYDIEIAKNGCWSFFAAFKQMELNYERWYVTLPETEALSSAKKLLVTENETAENSSTTDITRLIAGSESTEKRWNVILVCMESMSSDYMSYVNPQKTGNTPVLDRLRDESVFFENLYATGTRTVRGMEALTLNLPPTPGQAIIYRPEADKDHAAGKPFHFFCMTTSNHRPYLYPAGCIDLTPDGHSAGAIKYADWALGELIRKASAKPWFENTIFVIVSDHCARSAGKQDIDVRNYRIPGMIYNPSLVGKQRINRLSSQIDVMPTLFGMMGWGHETLGYGHDLLAPSAASLPERSFVSNYQKIAMITPESMTILKPNSKHSSYDLHLATGEITPMDPEQVECTPLLHDTTAFYQSASWLFNSGNLKRN